MTKTASDGVGLTKQAYGLAQDLMTPNATVYWADMLVSVALMWGGVDPQQPPIMLTHPLSANALLSRAISSGVSS